MTITCFGYFAIILLISLGLLQMIFACADHQVDEKVKYNSLFYMIVILLTACKQISFVLNGRKLKAFLDRLDFIFFNGKTDLAKIEIN